MYIFCTKISIYTYICIEKQFIADYIIKSLILLNRVHIVIENMQLVVSRLFAGAVVTRHFASDNRLSQDILLVTTSCHQTFC